MYTITNVWKRNYWKEYDYACIELPNGAKCNAAFFWHAVSLGVLNEND